MIGTLALEDYLEAGTIVFLFTIAEWLESRASHKVTLFHLCPPCPYLESNIIINNLHKISSKLKQLLSFYNLLNVCTQANAVMSSLMSIAPQKAVIAETGEEVDADEVKLNTVLAVKAGEVIPIDGIVVEGQCEVDEKALTGESFPVSKQQDSTVWAGTINLNGTHPPTTQNPFSDLLHDYIFFCCMIIFICYYYHDH